jgi:hypothetical protein
MNPHPRIRKTIKWGGAAVTVLLVVVWIGSGWWPGRVVLCYSYAKWSFGFGDIGRWNPDPPMHGVKQELFVYKLPYFQVGLWGFGWRGISWSDWSCAFPLWIPALLVGSTSAAAWISDRAAKRRELVARLNLCPKCNYDRTGLAKDAVCPECGSAAP